MTDRPRVGLSRDDSAEIAEAFAAGLQSGHDRRDADLLNQQFAADIIWGSPFGALVEGFDQLHPIHVRFQQQSHGGPSFRYAVRHVLRVSDDVLIAHIARLALASSGEPLPPSNTPSAPFSEMAMYVLVRHDGHWLLAPGQNTPMRPGGAIPPTT